MNPNGDGSEILRVWRCPVPEDQVAAFRGFMEENLFAALEDTPGCLSITAAVDRATDPPTVVAVSTWESMGALRDFTGPEKESGVIFPEAASYLAGEPSIQHLDVLLHQGP